MSSSYTTTTSATGMPTIDMEYHTKKANAKANASPSTKMASKHKGNRSKSYAGSMTPAERNSLLKSHSRSFSQSHSPSSNSPLTNKREQTNSDETIFKVEIERGKPVFFEGMDASESDNEMNESADDVNNIELTSSKDVISLTGANSSNLGNRTKFTLDERLEDVKETPEDNNVKTDTIPEKVDEACKDGIVEEVESSNDKQSATTSPILEPPKRSLRKLSDTSRTLRNFDAEKLSGSDENNDNSSSENLVIPAYWCYET